MSLILKQESNASVPTPPAGKGTLFLNVSDQVVVKDSAGNIATFLSLNSGGNTQVVFNDAGQIGGNANFIYTKGNSTLTVANLIVTDSLSAGDITVSSIANGNSNVDIVGAGGNVGISVAGNANILTVTGTGANISGTANVTGNITAGNLNTAGKVVASTLESNVANGTAPLAVASQTVVANLNADLLDGYNTSTSNSANTVAVRNADGNLSANYFIGNGSQLTGIDATSIQNGNSNVKVAANGNVTVSIAGTSNIINVSGTDITVAANILPNANITYDIGTPTQRFKDIYLANSTIYLGNAATITANSTAIIFTNPDGGNYVVTGNQNQTTAQLINGNSNVITTANGNVSTSVGGNANVFVVTSTGVNVAGTLNATGNLVAGNISVTGNLAISQLTSGNSGIEIVPNGNVNISSGGTSNVVVITSTGANITGTANITGNANVGNLGATGVTATTLGGTLTTAAQPNITSVGTLTSATVTGNVTAGNVYANSGTIGASLLTGTLTTAAQPNITSVGTLTSLTATGNVVAGNVYSNSGTIGASLLTGTLTTAAQPNVTSLGTLTSLAVTGNITSGNANLGNLATANFFTGTLTTAAQPNITSLGTLSSLTSSGNVQANGNLITDTILGRTSGITVTAAGTNTNITLVPNGTGTVDVSSKRITSLATPTQSTDAATKDYVDNIAQGLHVHAPCSAATPDTLANISVGTVTYNNGSSGVGATLTTTGSYTTIDGVNIATIGTRILVKNEANAAHNGIYTYSSSTVLTRATDFDTPTEMAGGDFTFVQNGTLYNDTGWVMTDPVTTVGTTNCNWAQFSGAGTYTAGTGLTLTGTQFSITNTAVSAASYGNGDRVASFTVNQQGQLTAASNVVIAANAANLTGTTLATSIVTSSLTTVGTLGSLTVTGNTTSGNVYANSGTIGASLLTGTLTTAAQPNITSTGTLTSLTVSGNGTFGNILGPHANGNSNVNIPAANGNVNISAVGNANVLIVTGTGVNVAGTFNATGNLTAGNITTGGGSGGNITGANVISANTFNGVLANGNSNVSIPAANGNVNISAVGNANILIVTGTGVNVAGTLNATGNANVGNIGGTGAVFTTLGGTLTTAAQPNITSTGTLTSLTVTGTTTSGNFATAGNITASFLVSNVATGTAPLTVTSTTRVSNLNVAYANVADFDAVSVASTGTFYPTFINAATAGNYAAQTNSAFTFNAATGAFNATLLGGTLTTAAQPNITSVGTLTSLTVTGNVSGGNLTTGGLVSATGNITGSNIISTTNHIFSVATGVSAAGSTQGTATALTKDINVVSTVSSGQGVVLPTAVAGMRITVMNTSANSLSVYPATSGIINSAAANAAYSLVSGGRLDFLATTTTQWYTLGATFA